LTRAFDSEFPRGTLKRFHPAVSEIVDLTAASDQMKMIDNLATSQVKVNVIDVRAGLLSPTLRTFTEVGFFDLVRAGEFNFALFHIIGPTLASLDEIGDVMPYAGGHNYFVVKNFINDASFFDWNPDIYKNYFRMVKEAPEINIPRLNEMAYEQVELAGVPFASFVANKTIDNQPANNSLVLRGYVRTWLNHIRTVPAKSRAVRVSRNDSPECFKLVGWSANLRPARPLHAYVSFLQAARKCSSTNTRSADDRLPSTRLLAMEVRRADVVISRSAAISRSACQNGSSRLMLVLCPATFTERLRIGEATV
jgi:hypothetical protein